MRRNKVQGIAIPTVDVSELGIAEADGVLQHGLRILAEDRRVSC